MADTKISALPAVAVPAAGDEFACNQTGVTKKETKAQITAATDAALATHVAVTATPIHGSSVAAAVNTLMHRDAAGRSQIAAPAAGADVSTKTYVDAQTHVAGYGALITPAGITDRTRKFLVPCIGGYEGANDLVNKSIKGLLLVDAQTTFFYGEFMVPEDFVANMTITTVINPDATGNIELQTSVWGNTCGGAYNTSWGSTLVQAIGVTMGNLNCIQATVVNATAGRILQVEGQRQGGLGTDTVNANCYCRGWVVEYTADS